MLTRTSIFRFVSQSSAYPSALGAWRTGASAIFLALTVGAAGCSSSTTTPSGGDEDTGTPGVDSGGTDTGATCSGDQKVCGGACTSVQFDPNNCGDCGKKCAAGEVCSLGACKTSCDAPLTKCGASCTDTKLDPNNCGT